MTVTTRQNYDKVMWTEIDQIATMTFAKEKAMAEGLSKGEAKKAREIAKTMLADKVDPDVIAKYTGLPVEEIAQLNAR